MLRDKLRRDDGQTMTEYAVVLGVITFGIVLVLGQYSVAIEDAIARIVKIFPVG